MKADCYKGHELRAIIIVLSDYISMKKNFQVYPLYT
jgi:hypothetical protein